VLVGAITPRKDPRIVHQAPELPPDLRWPVSDTDIVAMGKQRRKIPERWRKARVIVCIQVLWLRLLASAFCNWRSQHAREMQLEGECSEGYGYLIRNL
jgi:hypothetical protein